MIRDDSSVLNSGIFAFLKGLQHFGQCLSNYYPYSKTILSYSELQCSMQYSQKLVKHPLWEQAIGFQIILLHNEPR